MRTTSGSVYDFTVDTIDGENICMSRYRKKVLLIVNTASNCGFTAQYNGLEALYRNFADQGLMILGFPCNQFGKQEPGDAAEIATFCKTTHDVTFPMFSKIEVNGDSTIPLYAWLKKQAPGFLGSTAIKWNFTKFLIDRRGTVVGRFAPTTRPETLRADIERLLRFGS